MAVYLKDHKVLLSPDHNVAISSDCCCGNGACCHCDGTCDGNIHQTDCESGGGHWVPNGSCDPNPCVTGACCNASGVSCSVITQECCTNQGGTYQGDMTTCTPNPCATGACCLPGTTPLCIGSQTHAQCISLMGTYQGDGSTCTPNPCVSTGACCYSDGSCVVHTSADCMSSGGTYQGDGTVCIPNPCPSSSTGACCPGGGQSCIVETQSQCTGAGGHYLGNGTTCLGVDCLNEGCGIDCCFGHPEAPAQSCLMVNDMTGFHTCYPAGNGVCGDCSFLACVLHLDCTLPGFLCSCSDTGSCFIGFDCIADNIDITDCFNMGGVNWICHGSCP